MRNSIAFCAHRSQVSAARALSLCAFFLCSGAFILRPLSAGPESLAAASPRQAPARPRNAGAAWLSISYAEYRKWRDQREEEPEESRARVLRAVCNVQEHAVTQAISSIQGPCAASDDTCRRTLHDRGLLVWRTLETVIGRERVDRTVVEFSRRVATPNTLDDFIAFAEQVSGRKLGWFFDYYLHGTELPEIALRRIQGSAPNEVAGEIVVRNAPREYQVRVELRLYTTGGLINHSVATNGTLTPFTVISDETVTRIEVDPDQRILRRLPAKP